MRDNTCIINHSNFIVAIIFIVNKMSDLPQAVYWKNSYNVTSSTSISGYSRAAENTGFYCKELEMAFDAGVQTNEMPAYICLTHLHNDHTCALNKMLINNKKNPIIFIPNNEKLEYLLVSTLKLIYLSSKFIHPDSEKGKNQKTTYPYRIVKLNIGQSYQFRQVNSGAYYVEGLPSDHGVASISFGVYEMRKRCKQEYKLLEKKEYENLRKNGTVFTELYKFPILCFMSDTNYKPMIGSTSYLLFQYETIIVECTFLESADLSHATKKNHIHWNHLEPIIRTKTNKFILTHFSKKYTWLQIKSFFDKVHKENPLHNVVLWLYTGIVEYI